MKIIYFVLLFLVCSGSGFSQQPANVAATIEGKVLDSKTNEPIGFTNIGLEGTFFGTAGNNEGYFKLEIPDDLKDNDIFFSAVGYVNYKVPVSQLFGNDYLIIKLEPQNYSIDNVDVIAQSKVLMRILTMAAENTPHNMVAGPLNYNAKYTNTIVTESTVNQTAEVLFYDKTGYLNPSKLDAFRNLKYTIHKSEWEADYRFSTGKTEIDNLLSFDWLRTGSSVLNPGILMQFELELVSEQLVLGKDSWIISFKQNNPTLEGSGDFYATEFNGKITIRKEDYGVVRIEGEVSSPKNSQQGRSLAVGKKSAGNLENVNYKFITEYRNLLPSSVSIDKTYVKNNKNITEKSRLEITTVKITNLTLLDSRDYFTGN
ncbi:MAG: carboxypeptidase-like regulatory domain-containing protein [Prolixibacteraceae bacterium]|nr:carboxypeptidase-like regulatory domain-containing protein [Prolixibacteraceae bacterium]